MERKANAEAGFVELAERLKAVSQAHQTSEIHLVMEPTGGYELAFACYGYQQGWKVSLPNPKYVREWAKGLGQRAKTDKQDALLLARFAAERQPLAWQPLPDEVSELECLLERQRDARTIVGARAKPMGIAAKPSWNCQKRCQ